MAKGRDLFEAALSAEGVTGTLADVARSIYMQESGGGRNTKTSNAGAVGGMQIIPSTFKSVADKDWDISDPMHNARAGIRYLSQLNKQSGGDPALTAAGYYGGPGGMEKARRGIAVSDPRNPNAPNTLQYGQQVAARLGKAPAPVTQAAQTVPPAPVGVPIESAPPVVAQTAAASSEAAPSAEAVAVPDAWQAFLDRVREAKTPEHPVQVADLQYGAPQMQINVPDFMATVGGRMPQRPLDFSAFGSWGPSNGRA